MNKLNAWLRPNLLTEDKSDFIAVPQSIGSLTVKDIVEDMRREGMEIKIETVIDIISRFNRKAAERVLSGYNVNTGLVYMRPMIKGVFHSKIWSPDIHYVYVAMHQGYDLRKAVADTTVTILGEQSTPIEIYSITDKYTGATDGTLTPGKNSELKGSYIKIIGEDPECGIIFLDTTTGEKIRLDMTDIVINEPSRLLILVPETLPSGEYEITVTTQYTGGNYLLKVPRTATLGHPVVIA